MGRKRSRQHRFKFPLKHGGRRRGSGRKPSGSKAGVSHAKREEFDSEQPNHVTMTAIGGFPMRTPRAREVIEEQFRRANGRHDCIITVYSIQDEHLHLVVEAPYAEALAKAVKGLAVRITRALNKLWERKGKFWRDRYHNVVIKSARQMRNVLRYVLRNSEKHGEIHVGRPDPCSSGRFFTGYSNYTPDPDDLAGDPPVLPPRSRVQLEGWKRHGLIPVSCTSCPF